MNLLIMFRRCSDPLPMASTFIFFLRACSAWRRKLFHMGFFPTLEVGVVVFLPLWTSLALVHLLLFLLFVAAPARCCSSCPSCCSSCYPSCCSTRCSSCCSSCWSSCCSSSCSFCCSNSFSQCKRLPLFLTAGPPGRPEDCLMHSFCKTLRPPPDVYV